MMAAYYKNRATGAGTWSSPSTQITTQKMKPEDAGFSSKSNIFEASEHGKQ